MMSFISDHKDFAIPQYSEAVVLNTFERFIGNNLRQNLL